MNKIELLHEIKKDTKIEQGQIWIHKDEDTYIVARISHNEYCLMSLQDGNRYSDPLNIEDIFCGDQDEFTLYKGILKIDTSSSN